VEIMATNDNNNSNENNENLDKKANSQEELFRSMMVKEMLNKIENKLKSDDSENVLKTIKNIADESAIIQALKKIKDK
jgi:hypothetical protein